MLRSLMKNLFNRGLPPAPSGHARRLHLGCGRDIRPGWVNLDAHALPGVDVVADLDACRVKPLPFHDNSFDEFYGCHVLEHLRDPLPLMQELHRIASPGAVAVFRVPHGASDDAHEDPTHVQRYFPNSFPYFSQLAYWRADYGYRGDWETEHVVIRVDASRHDGKTDERLLEELRSQRNVALEIVATLRAVKPMRRPGSAQAKGARVRIDRMPKDGAQ